MTAFMKRFVIQYNFCCRAGTIRHKNFWKGNVFTDRKCTNRCASSASGKLTVALHLLQHHNCCYVRRALTHTKRSSHSCVSVCFLGVLLDHHEPCVPHNGDGVFVWRDLTVRLWFRRISLPSIFEPGPVNVRCVVDIVVLEQVFLEVLSVFPSQYRSTIGPSSSSSYQKEGCQKTWKLPSESLSEIRGSEAALPKLQVLCDATPWRWVKSCRRFGG